MPRRLIRIKAVKEMTGQSDATIWRKVKVGDFPQPVRLAVSSSAWVLDEVEAWVEARIAERDARLGRKASARADSPEPLPVDGAGP